MQKNKISTLLFLLVWLAHSPTLLAQNLSELAPRLASLAKTMVQDTFPANRLKAAEEFNPLFINALQQKDAYKFQFDSLVNISIQSPEDSSFRLFTWQLVKDANTYQYFGAIQFKGKKPKVVVLEDKFQTIEEKEFADCSPENWCGGVIYKIKMFQAKGGKHYLLFGFNINTLFERAKFVDVLKIRDGKCTFGAPLFFHKEKETRKRLIVTYSADTKVRMNYDDELQMIVHDHLIGQKNELIGGMTFVPDGDFVGYRLEKGVWQYVDDAVVTTPMDKPMMPNPILDKRKKKDVFGKKVKG